MNIYDYIEEYGKYTFNEKKINEVDLVIFSFLSYASLDKIFEDTKSITIGEAGSKFIKLYRTKDINIFAVREANKILKSIRNSERYKDCLLFNYEYTGNKLLQFGAVSIEYLPNKVYVSFEGTDSLFSGWRENFMLGYEFPTISHKAAIKYLNRHFTFSNKELIVGGHSKGGNLALVASMYTNLFVRRKITKVINADGPGLLDREYKSKRYKNLKKKYIHIIPNYSLIGIFLNNSNDYVVKSFTKGILAHDIAYWEVDANHFVRTKLSAYSKELDKNIDKWFNKYEKQDKADFINNLDLVLEEAEVFSILDIKRRKRKILSIIHSSKNMNNKTKKVIVEFIGIIIKCFGDAKKIEIKDFITNTFKIPNREKDNNI